MLAGSRSDLGGEARAASFYSGYCDLRADEDSIASGAADRADARLLRGPAGRAGSRSRQPRRRGLRAAGRGLVGGDGRSGRAASRRPLPPSPDAPQRGGRADSAGGPRRWPRARHRAADAGTDRRRCAGRLGSTPRSGGADLRVGGDLQSHRRQRPQRPRPRRRAARPRPGPLRLHPQRLRPDLLSRRRSTAAHTGDASLVEEPQRLATRRAAGNRRLYGARPDGPGRVVLLTSAASPRSSACLC